MNMWQPKFITILIVNIFLLLCSPVIASDIHSIQDELKSNTKMIAQKKKEEKDILNRLSRLRKNIYQTRRKLNNAYKKYQSYQTKITNTESKLAAEEAALKNSSVC